MSHKSSEGPVVSGLSGTIQTSFPTSRHGHSRVKDFFYGLPQIGDKGTFPAVIDTGSTMIAVPTPLFSAL